MSYTNRLEEAVRQAESASEIARQWANGPENTTVPTESGPLPTIAELMRQKANEIDENAANIALFESNLAAEKSTVPVGGAPAGSLADSLYFARSAAAISRLVEPSTAKQFGLYRLDQNNYFVWRPLGGQFWQRWLLNRDTNTVPFNLNEMYIKQVLGYIAAQDTGVTYTGTWATTNGTSALSSASDTTYISGRARQAIAAGDYVEVSYNGGGDLYVVFSGRTTGNYVNVLLDGKKDYLTLPDDGSGNKYFDSYTPVDLTHKQLIRIAQGVPNGNHTIRLTVQHRKTQARQVIGLYSMRCHLIVMKLGLG